jgi:DNA-binding transcriptional MerR regulator
MAKLKYPPNTMRLAEVLCQQTALTAKESAELLGVPARTLQDWWKKLPLPGHRKAVQGARPEDPVASLEGRIKELEASLEDQNARVEEATGESPKDTKSLIDLARLQLQRQLSGSGCLAKMGEVAAALRVLVDVRKEEIDAAIQDRCKVIYYLPGGKCPSCGAESHKIRPEDLIGDTDMSRPN